MFLLKVGDGGAFWEDMLFNVLPKTLDNDSIFNHQVVFPPLKLNIGSWRHV